MINMASKSVEFLVGLVILLVIGSVIYLSVKEGWLGQEMVKYQKCPQYMNWVPASSTVQGKKQVTFLGKERPYWIIPKEKRPDGGWDSIDGFWDAETPKRWNEGWQNDFCMFD